MRILVLCVYYASNLGDAVIGDCVAALLKARWPGADVVIRDLEPRTAFTVPEEPPVSQLKKMSRDTLRGAFFSRYTPRDSVLRGQARAVEQNRAYVDEVCAQDWDCVVFAGGELMMDWLSLDTAGYLNRFAARGVPVYLNALGVGCSWSKRLQEILRQALQHPNVRLVSCRDDVAEANRRYGSESVSIVATSDPALWAERVYPRTVPPERDTIGLGVIYTPLISFRKQIRFWLALIRLLEEQGIRWKFFCNGEGNDVSVARYLLSILPGTREEQEFLAPRPAAPRELADLLDSFRGVISFRLHSHIISWSLGRPSVGLNWDQKVPIFFQKINHPERCFDLPASPEQVLDTFRSAETEGCDRQLLEQQRCSARDLLLNAMQTDLG